MVSHFLALHMRNYINTLRDYTRLYIYVSAKRRKLAPQWAAASLYVVYIRDAPTRGCKRHMGRRVLLVSCVCGDRHFWQATAPEGEATKTTQHQQQHTHSFLYHPFLRARAPLPCTYKSVYVIPSLTGISITRRARFCSSSTVTCQRGPLKAPPAAAAHTVFLYYILYNINNIFRAKRNKF